MVDQNLLFKNKKEAGGLMDLLRLQETLGGGISKCIPAQLAVGDVASINYGGKSYIIVVTETDRAIMGKYMARGTLNILLTAYVRPEYMRWGSTFGELTSRLYKKGITKGSKVQQIRYQHQNTISKKKVAKIVDDLTGEMPTPIEYSEFEYANLESRIKEKINAVADRVPEKDETVAEGLGEENFRTFIVEKIASPCARIR